MKHRLFLNVCAVFLLLCAMLCLTSCGEDAAVPVPAETASPEPTSSPIPTPTPEPTPCPVVEAFGMEYDRYAESLDLSGIPMENTAELESVLPEFPSLTKVEMCGCGIPDEEMADLGERWPGIRFVWEVYFAGFTLRTDADQFIAAAFDDVDKLNDYNIGPLKYCTDLIGLDLGHQYFSDLSFLHGMTKLQYLILAECPNILDISEIGNLSELIYLEIFLTNITDISPLINCTKLLDLNIAHCYWIPAQNALYTLTRMPQLERLWYCGSPLVQSQVNTLKRALPDCQMNLLLHGESTGGTWRYHERYYAMRDVFGMYYMPGGTNGVDANGDQIIRTDSGAEYHLVGWDLRQDWWTMYGFTSMPE